MTEKIQVTNNGRNGWYRVIINITDQNSVGVIINQKEGKQLFNDLRALLKEPIDGEIEKLEQVIKIVPIFVEKEVVQEKVKIVEKEVLVEVPILKIVEKKIQYTVEGGVTDYKCSQQDIINFLRHADLQSVEYILKESKIDFGLEEFIIVDDEPLNEIPFGDRKTKLIQAVRPASSKQLKTEVETEVKNKTFVSKITSFFKNWF
jgi:hypothetical protein